MISKTLGAYRCISKAVYAKPDTARAARLSVPGWRMAREPADRRHRSRVPLKAGKVEGPQSRRNHVYFIRLVTF